MDGAQHKTVNLVEILFVSIALLYDSPAGAVGEKVCCNDAHKKYGNLKAGSCRPAGESRGVAGSLFSVLSGPAAPVSLPPAGPCSCL